MNAETGLDAEGLDAYRREVSRLMAENKLLRAAADPAKVGAVGDLVKHATRLVQIERDDARAERDALKAAIEKLTTDWKRRARFAQERVNAADKYVEEVRWNAWRTAYECLATELLAALDTPNGSGGSVATGGRTSNTTGAPTDPETCGDEDPAISVDGSIVCTLPKGHDAHRSSKRPGTAWTYLRDNEAEAAIERARAQMDEMDGGTGIAVELGLLDPPDLTVVRHVTSKVRAALDTPTAPESPSGDGWLKQIADMSLAAARDKFGPGFAPESPESEETDHG